MSTCFNNNRLPPSDCYKNSPGSDTSMDEWILLDTNTTTEITDTDESWVELGPSPDRTTPLPFAPTEEYLRLLREAQRESNQSSARVSLASSRKGSPKSPPNSPNTELSIDEDLKGVYINYHGKEGEWVGVDKSTDWIWDWSSRPDQAPPKDWKFKHPARKMLSIRTAKVGKIALFSREMMYTILITNVLSLIIGTGMGMWLSRRGCLMTAIKLD